MFNRYSEQTSKRDTVTKVRYYKPTLYPDIPERDDDIIHKVRSGERLDLLAHQYYNDVGLWWLISRANKLDPSDITLKAATDIRIPTHIGPILQELTATNTG
ncbi:MAG: hypothetical protein CMB80_22605 [Flammeovirgaceae bacterium]|nr:hypothetical protein [Flammeovirgaceae bacterium]